MKHTTTLVQRGSLMLIVCLLIATPRLAAQSNYSQKSATRQITAGLYGVIGLSHAFTGQEGDGVFREDEITVPTLAWRAGAVAGYPITPVIRATLGLGLDARGFHSEIPSSLGRTAVTSNIRYFSITPGMQFSAFTLALNIGLPMGGELYIGRCNRGLR